jgi:hypothetical protein
MHVSDKPAVSLESNYSYLYQLGMNYTLKCKIVGFPQPHIKWFFSECDLMDECEELEFKEVQVRYLLQIVNFELFRDFIYV